MWLTAVTPEDALTSDQLVDPAAADLHTRLYIERHVESYAERHIRLYTDTRSRTKRSVAIIRSVRPVERS